MATKVEFKRVETDAEVENIDIKDGQLIYTGTGKTYMDYGNQRIPTGSGGSSVTVDTAMSDTSTNAVQNKVIKEYVDSQTVPEEVIVSDTQPTGDDWKLWIDKGEIGSQASEITNSYSTSTGLGYSANYVNNKIEPIIISQNDFLTLNSGFTITQYTINKIGKYYTGTIVLKTDTFVTGDIKPFILKNKPISSSYTFCGISDIDWSVKKIGYYFHSSSTGEVVINEESNFNYQYVIININYIAQ